MTNADRCFWTDTTQFDETVRQDPTDALCHKVPLHSPFSVSYNDRSDLSSVGAGVYVFPKKNVNSICRLSGLLGVRGSVVCRGRVPSARRGGTGMVVVEEFSFVGLLPELFVDCFS